MSTSLSSYRDSLKTLLQLQKDVPTNLSAMTLHSTQMHLSMLLFVLDMRKGQVSPEDSETFRSLETSFNEAMQGMERASTVKLALLEAASSTEATRDSKT